MMNTQIRDQKRSPYEKAAMGTTRNLTVTENQALGQLCSIACPQCHGKIDWHLKGRSWRGKCMTCTQKLRGKANDSACLEATFLPEEHIYLNIRGC